MLPGLEPVRLPTDAVEVGRVADAWGVKGWFKVIAYSADPLALLSSRNWFLLPPSTGERSFSDPVGLAISEARTHANAVVASAREVTNRQVAEALRGARVFVSRSSFPTTGEDEYYWVDLIGLTVLNREGENLGNVREMISTGAQTVLVLDDHRDETSIERMIPFVAAYVDDVDLSGGRILVDWQSSFG